MTEIQIDAGTLTANRDERTVTGLLLPFGEECRSNLGRFKVDTGAFSLPADASIVGLNEEHVRELPLGRATQLRETDQGVVATFSVARTPDGDRALEDIASGARRHLSVETANVVIRSGKAVAGRIFGAALVAKPAFPSATLLAAAVDSGEPEEPQEETHEEHTTAPDGSEHDTTTTVTKQTEQTEDGKTKTTTTTVVVEEITPADPAEGGTTVTQPAPAAATAAPQPLLARLRGTEQAPAPAPRAPQLPPPVSASTLFAAMAATSGGRGDRHLREWLRDQEEAGGELFPDAEDTLTAALTDIKATTVPSGGVAILPTLQQPQFLGEVWRLKTYERRYIPLFASGALTSITRTGWKWKTKPGVAAWTGNKTDVPSNPVEVAPYTAGITRLAGAHDIDRTFRDFSVPEFWESYYRYMAESYAKQSDQGVLAAAIAGATAVTPGTVPTGIGPGVSTLVDCVLSVIDQGSPTFALVGKALWREMLLTPKDKVLEYLSMAMGVEEGTALNFRIAPAAGADLAARQVFVGIGGAVRSYELPGSPIRVEGLDVAKGGIDPGLFGYYGVDVLESTCLALATAPAAS